jgi:hypothetical protein
MDTLRGEWGWCERLVIVRAEDFGAIPGSLKVDHHAAPARLARRFGTKVTTLVIQPERPGRPLDFDARLNEALARHILEQISGRTNP